MATPTGIALLTVCGLAAFGVDQITKLWALRAGRRAAAGCGFILRAPAPVMLLAWFLAACIAAALTGFAQLPDTGVTGIGLAAGGAAGNLIDRLLRGSVPDFIAVGRVSAFNLADVAILGGVLLAAVSLL